MKYSLLFFVIVISAAIRISAMEEDEFNFIQPDQLTVQNFQENKNEIAKLTIQTNNQTQQTNQLIAELAALKNVVSHVVEEKTDMQTKLNQLQQVNIAFETRYKAVLDDNKLLHEHLMQMEKQVKEVVEDKTKDENQIEELRLELSQTTKRVDILKNHISNLYFYVSGLKGLNCFSSSGRGWCPEYVLPPDFNYKFW